MRWYSFSFHSLLLFLITCVVVGGTTRQQKDIVSNNHMHQVVLKNDADIDIRCICSIEPTYDGRIHALHIKVAEIEQDLIEIKGVSPDEKTSISFYFALIGWSTTAVIGLAGLSLGWGVYRSLVDSKRIYLQTIQKLECKLGTWISEKEIEFKNKTISLMEKLVDETNRYSYFIRLTMYIATVPDPEPNEVFPLLTPLVSKPELEYRALFDRIKKKRLGAEIDAKINVAIKKLDLLKKNVGKPKK